jgi:hypothetical protein
MATQRSFVDAFKLTDLTEELNLIPNTWGLINELGLFGEQSVAQSTIEFESKSGTIAVVPDQFRGNRNTVNKDDGRIIKAFSLTHHPLDDYLTGQDLAGVRAYGESNAADTEAAAIERKLMRIRQNHAITLEAARAHTITSGTQFAPNGTVSSNFYTDFGVTRKEVDFTLGATGSAVVLEKSEEVIAHIQDNLFTGAVAGGITALCSPEFFAKLIKQAGVLEAYRFYSSVQEPQRNRLGGSNALYRRFEHGGVTYIEYRGSYNNARLIPAGDAYFVPTNVPDLMTTFYGPARKLSAVNTLGEQAYVWTYRDPKDNFIEIESECNLLNLLARPAVVVRAFSSN